MSRSTPWPAGTEGFPPTLLSCFMSRDLLDREVRRAVALLPGVKNAATAMRSPPSPAGTARSSGVRCRGARGREGRGERSPPIWSSTPPAASRARAQWLDCARLRHDAGDDGGRLPRLCHAALPPPRRGRAGSRPMLVRSRRVTTRAGAIFPSRAGAAWSRWRASHADYPPRGRRTASWSLPEASACPSSTPPSAAAEPLAPAAGYRRSTNRWRLYHQAERWPEGFVALGDSVCAFNPYYGQGMAVAARSAVLLGNLAGRARAGPGFAAGISAVWRAFSPRHG